ncbi:MAG: DUF2577 domain-containing protein [Eubacterium sp.]|nr:DUF2577 domain-containing protein [Eubacterium sp.]
MFSASRFMDIIKRCAVESVEARDPMQIMVGKVISIDPLKIFLDQRVILSEKFLIIPPTLTDYTIEAEVDHLTENAFDGDSEKEHNHKYSGKKEFKILNKLEVDDRVLVLREQGGQKFYVINKLGKADKGHE